MVDLKNILVKLFEKLTKYEDLGEFHQIYTPSVKNAVHKEFLEQRKEETSVAIPKLIERIFSEYGPHILTFRMLDKHKENRYITGHGNFVTIDAFDIGGFNKILTYKNNKEVYIDIPMEGAFLLENLSYGRYIVAKEKEKEKEYEDVDLFLFDYPNSFSKLTVDVNQYFELLSETMGMYCWQSYVTDPTYTLNGMIPDNFHENMEKLFPKVSLNIFRKKASLKESVFNTYEALDDKVNYRKTFLESMEILKKNPKITFKYYQKKEGYILDKTTFTARYGVSEQVLRKIHKDYQREIPESMLSFYYQMNGCEVYWAYEDDGDEESNIEGKINLLPLEEVMGGKWNRYYLDWSSEDLFKDEDAVYYFNEEEAKENPEMAEFMKKARIFEQHGEMRDFFIEFIEGQEEPNIYRIIRDKFYKMNIDFRTYVNARIYFLGILGWEYKFFNHPDYDEKEINQLVKKFKKKVSRIINNPDFEIIN